MAKLLRLEDVQEKIGGLCRTTIWKLEKDGLFPKRRSLTKKNVRWDESEIDAWIKSRARGAGLKPDIRHTAKSCLPK